MRPVRAQAVAHPADSCGLAAGALHAALLPHACRRNGLLVDAPSPGTDRIDRRWKRLACQGLAGLCAHRFADRERRSVETCRSGSSAGHEIQSEGRFRLDRLDAERAIDDVQLDVEAA